eukprot:12891564-Prorocentrum_lima.AAC.1
MVSVLPYRAQIHPLPNIARLMLQDTMRQCFRTHGWCPWWVPAGIGTIYGAPTAPQCPVAQAQAAHIIALAIGRFWGPL